jgi:hypothetical protein
MHACVDERANIFISMSFNSKSNLNKNELLFSTQSKRNYNFCTENYLYRKKKKKQKVNMRFRKFKLLFFNSRVFHFECVHKYRERENKDDDDDDDII